MRTLIPTVLAAAAVSSTPPTRVCTPASAPARW